MYKSLKNTCKTGLSVLFVLISANFLSAQTDTVNAGNNRLLTAGLKEGKSVYLVYYTDSLLNRKGVGDLWERSTQFINYRGRPAVQFNWKWMRGDSILSTITNICDRKTLAPVFHKAVRKTKGIAAYNFMNGAMVPADTVASNTAVQRGKVALPIPVISWEQDMETYPLLPIKNVGQKFEIAFFDPNEKEPKYHRYEIVGKEPLQLNKDTRINCWLLKIEYQPGAYAIFWLTEKSKEMVKMKEFYNGSYRFKVRLY